MKKILIVLLFCICSCCFLFGAAACKKVVSVNGISFTQNIIELYVGDEYQLEYTISPENASNTDVSFYSSDESILTIKNGVVYAISQGEVTVTVVTEDGSYSGICNIVVKAVEEETQGEVQEETGNTDEEQKEEAKETEEDTKDSENSEDSEKGEESDLTEDQEDPEVPNEPDESDEPNETDEPNDTDNTGGQDSQNQYDDTSDNEDQSGDHEQGESENNDEQSGNDEDNEGQEDGEGDNNEGEEEDPDYQTTVYTVTFIADDETVAVCNFTKDNLTVDEPQPPEKYGYTVSWASYTLSCKDITVYAVYTPIIYSINFVNYSGDIIYRTTYTLENTTITEPQVPARQYYNGVWESYELDGGDVIVKPVYTPIEYTITFISQSNVVSTQIYTVENRSITEPEVPEVQYYSGEWEKYSLNFKNITVSAVYTPIEYSVVFMTQNKVISTQVYTVESMSITEPEVPEVQYYNGEWAQYSLNFENITVYAVYTPIEYTITYIANGLVYKKVIFTIESETIDEPSVPSIAGYDGVWESYSIAYEDFTVNAVYTLTTYTITYENTKGADNPNPVSYNSENVFALTDISADGYIFEGWYIDDRKINSVNSSYGDLVITAKWSLVEYTIRFVDENRNNIIATVTYTIEDTEITLPEVPEKEGYIGSWSAFKLTYDDEVLVVRAVYTKI